MTEWPIPSNKARVPNPDTRTPSPEHQVPSTESYRVPNTAYSTEYHICNLIYAIVYMSKYQ